MPERVILHLDMDAFFAAVEVLGNPSLRGRPLIVGGLPGDRGVVSTASYEARSFGVRSGMPLREAERRCPQAIFIPCHPAPYVWFSTRILRLLLKRTPRVELFSIDEAFIDGEGLCADRAAAVRLSEEISREIREGLGLTCSFGIGPNKLIAKMASKLRKPAGITALTVAEFREVFHSRPVQALFGVGERTARALTRLGIVTVGDLAKAAPVRLAGHFGLVGPDLAAAANGIDRSPVIPYGEGPPAKSIGHEHTFETDQWDRGEIDRLLLSLCDQVARALRAEKRRARCLHLKVRMADFTTFTRQMTVERGLDSGVELLGLARELFRRFDPGGAVRLIGVSASNLTGESKAVEDPLFPADRRARGVTRAVDEVRDRFGSRSLIPLGTVGSR